MSLHELAVAIFKAPLKEPELRTLSRVIQVMYWINASCMFRGRQFLQGSASIPDAFLQQAVADAKADTKNPMHALIGDDDHVKPNDLHLAMWELRRRKWLKEGGKWDFNYLPFLLTGEKPHEMERCGTVR